jgi:Domain of unknown function (DUF1330)
MLVGFGLGGLAVKVLHAQARAPGYMIAEIDVIDEAGYKKFVEGTSATVPASGGRYIVRGGICREWSVAKTCRRDPMGKLRKSAILLQFGGI